MKGPVTCECGHIIWKGLEHVVVGKNAEYAPLDQAASLDKAPKRKSAKAF
jgi:hypothetical protein